MTIPLFAPRDGLYFEPVSTWDHRIRRYIEAHYTNSGGAPPGKKQAWLVWEDSLAVGCVGLGEPSFRLAARRRLAGNAASDILPHTVNCWIFRVESHTGRASEILRAWLPVAEEQWAKRYGWRPVHIETLIGQDGEGGRLHHGGALGACFRRCGFRSLGWTTGLTVRRPPGHTHDDDGDSRVWSKGNTPKLVLYRGPLARLPPADVEWAMPQPEIGAPGG